MSLHLSKYHIVGNHMPWLKFILISVTICIINSYDTRWASGVQVFFTAAKLIAIAVIIIGGFIRLGQGKS